MELNIHRAYNNDVFPAYEQEMVCDCCGSRLIAAASTLHYYNPGITFATSKEEINEETEKYWTESIPVGDEFLVIKHRKVLED